MVLNIIAADGGYKEKGNHVNNIPSKTKAENTSFQVFPAFWLHIFLKTMRLIIGKLFNDHFTDE
jgi:hypothetical protein